MRIVDFHFSVEKLFLFQTLHFASLEIDVDIVVTGSCGETFTQQPPINRETNNTFV
jgi:hypothetical protein